MSDNYPSDWSTRRKEVYERDDFTCQNCGVSSRQGDSIELHAHHIVPVSSGGTHSKSNLKTLCQDCHSAIHGDNLAPTANTPNKINDKYSRTTTKKKANEQQEKKFRHPFANIKPFSICPICGSENDFSIVKKENIHVNDTVAKCASCRTKLSKKETSGFLFGEKLKISDSRHDINGYELNPLILKKMENEGGNNITELDKYEKKSDEWLTKIRNVGVGGIAIMIFTIPISILLGGVMMGFVGFFIIIVIYITYLKYLEKQITT